MNKLLTISIAGYNVEKFIGNTLDSLLIDEIDLLEVLVEDDGGTDSTADIVKKYEEKYPDSIHLIHKENGGYGSTINNSIKLATGKYFKQLDGDDWYDTESLSKLINEIKNIDVDVIYTPIFYCFEKDDSIIFDDCFKEIKTNIYYIHNVIQKSNKNISMHYLTYKTSLLKKNNITLLENCFYTDTEYAIYPFFYAKDIYISHNSIYCYRIGREGQSMSLEGIRKHYEDKLKVDNHFFDFVYLIDKLEINTKEYIMNYLAQTLSCEISWFLMCNRPFIKYYKLSRKRDKFIKNTSYALYKKMEEKGKCIRLLRKSHYLLYIPLSCYEINRIGRGKI